MDFSSANAPVCIAPVIVAAKRTPMGRFQGMLAHLNAYQLGGIAIKGLNLNQLANQVVMGCVLTAGQGQAPARQAALLAGIDHSTPCTTVNKVCGSGMKAVFMACDQIRLKQSTVVIAGGMESMSNAPYLLDRARGGYRIGHNTLIDHLYRDGLEDPYLQTKDGNRTLMGDFAEHTATKLNLSRSQQEQFVLQSLENYNKAADVGGFNAEIMAIECKNSKGEIITLGEDEQPKAVKTEKFAKLKPAFKEGGTITAATSSPLSDGAAALAIACPEAAARHNLKPLAKVMGYYSYADEPANFAMAPIGAVRGLCQRIGWSLDEVDLFEINEAFAVAPLALMTALHIPRGKVNTRGGACVLGHPLGSSGARIIVTLVHSLIQQNKKRGIAAICIGGGEATAIAIERPCI